MSVRALAVFVLLIAACDAGVNAGDASALADVDFARADADAANADANADVASADAGACENSPNGLSADFRAWLDAHGYSDDKFARDDVVGGSFGGRACAGDVLAHAPVIFVHGNSDRALPTSGTLTGWVASVNYFAAHGYSRAELYGTTWGDADATLASQQQHSQANVMHTRRFIDAVLAYTGAAHVDVVAHSMGVTLARKAIRGGMGSATDGGAYDVGAPLTNVVDTFIGISGANLGLTSCYAGVALPTCDAQLGLFPGTLVGTTVTGRSAFLNDLLATSSYEGAFRYALYSTADEVIGFGGLVYGAYTSKLPGETNEQVSSTQTHNQTKDETVATQLSLIMYHSF